jgi:hypothetical protein
MAQRRASSGGEVSLFPFLSILACLIGALVLIISALMAAQVGKTEGRTAEEIERAQDYQRMIKEIEERKKLEVLAKEKLAELEKLRQEIEEKEQRYLKLRKLLDTSKDVQEQNKEIAASLQKELDDLLTEIDGLKKQQDESKKMIAELMAEIKKREVPPDKKIPPVVVQPSGSGMPESTKVYFVECATGALKILNPWGEGDYRLSATADVVVADVAYNHFLTEVAKDKNSLILYLIRDDGQTSLQQRSRTRRRRLQHPHRQAAHPRTRRARPRPLCKSIVAKSRHHPRPQPAPALRRRSGQAQRPDPPLATAMAKAQTTAATQELTISTPSWMHDHECRRRAHHRPRGGRVISTAITRCKKILSDLPPVTPEEHQAKMLEVAKELPPPPADPKKIEEDREEARRAEAQEGHRPALKTVDTSDMSSPR